ncbi:hypothetical protein N9980_00055 [bacterium]|nr:hypothetical protein [bacterium]
MIAQPRVYFAVSFLAAGVLVAPLVRTDTQPINWEAMAQAYQDSIFSDGFEDGTTNNWTVTVNGTKATLVFPEGSPVVRDIMQSMDSFGRAWVPTAILVEHGYNGRGFNAGSNTLVDDCTVKIDETGVIVITFSLPPDF